MATKRRYRSSQRTEAALVTRNSVLSAARSLFGRRGIDKVTIGEIAEKAGVSPPTVYSLFKSKDGILQAIMRDSLFGARFQAAQAMMAGVDDAVRLVAMTAKVARAIYESESTDLGIMRGASTFSPALRKIEAEFEKIRYKMQAERLELLFAQDKAKRGLDIDTARRLMWMFTSRDIYRMLVIEGGWSVDRYEAWLAETLVGSLVESRAGRGSSP